MLFALWLVQYLSELVHIFWSFWRSETWKTFYVQSTSKPESNQIIRKCPHSSSNSLKCIRSWNSSVNSIALCLIVVDGKVSIFIQLSFEKTIFSSRLVYEFSQIAQPIFLALVVWSLASISAGLLVIQMKIVRFNSNMSKMLRLRRGLFSHFSHTMTSVQ